MEERDEEQEEQIVCSECGHVFDTFENRREVDGELYCNACFHEKFVECSECGEIVRREDAYYDDEDNWYCQSCWDDFPRCYHCDGVITDGDTFETHDGETICRSCYENSYSQCSECGEIYPDDEFDSCGRCPSCQLDAPEVYDYHDFDSCAYEEVRRGLFDKSDPISLGIELETDCDCGYSEDNVSELLNEQSFFHGEHDSSLDKGVEFVSLPATLKYHLSEWDGMGYDRMCRLLVGAGLRGHDTETAGLHIHIGAEALPTDYQRLVLWAVINKNRKWWTKIARRWCNTYASFTDAVGGYGRGYDRLCKAHCFDHDDRYHAVNFYALRKGTIELRLFRSSLRAATVKATLEIVHALVSMIRANAVSAATAFNNPEKAIDALVNWIISDKRYKYAIEYIYYRTSHPVARRRQEELVVRLAKKDEHDRKIRSENEEE